MRVTLGKRNVVGYAYVRGIVPGYVTTLLSAFGEQLAGSKREE